MKKTFITLAVCGLSLFLTSCGSGENKSTGSSENKTSTPSTATTPSESEEEALLQKYNCASCHKADEKLIGPAYKDVAQKGYSTDEMVNLMYNPKPENWPGYPPMLPQSLPKEDAQKIARWINTLK